MLMCHSYRFSSIHITSLLQIPFLLFFLFSFIYSSLISSWTSLIYIYFLPLLSLLSLCLTFISQYLFTMPSLLLPQSFGLLDNHCCIAASISYCLGNYNRAGRHGNILSRFHHQGQGEVWVLENTFSQRTLTYRQRQANSLCNPHTCTGILFICIQLTLTLTHMHSV